MTSRSPVLTLLGTGRVGKIPALPALSFRALRHTQDKLREKSKIPHIRSG
jgi:hypothetical protein